MKVIENVSNSQLSIARYYGGVNLNGIEYIYEAKTDRLIRNDYLKEYNKQNKAIKVKQENNQLNIFD
jgi:hypothetical protein